MGKCNNNGTKYEQYARLVLLELFPNEFANLQLSDRPDIIDRSSGLGIEVTHPCQPDYEEAESVFDKFFAEKSVADLDPKRLARFRKSGYDVLYFIENRVSGIRFLKGYSSQEWVMAQKAIQKKLNRLNAHLYQYENNICLYLASMLFNFDRDYDSFARALFFYAKKESNNYTLHFKELFYDNSVYLYRIDIDNETIMRYDLESVTARQRIKEDNNDRPWSSDQKSKNGT